MNNFQNDDIKIEIKYFNGKPIKISKNMRTGEILLDSEDAAKALGFENMEEMIYSIPKIRETYIQGIMDGKVKKQ